MNPRQSSMTGVQVMVASTILSLLMLGAVTAFRTFGNSYQRVNSDIAQVERMREVSRFLRESLRLAVPDTNAFDATQRELVWLAPLDRVGSAGGLQYLRLRQVGQELVLSFAPYAVGGSRPPWGSSVPDYVLVSDLTSFRVELLLPDAKGQRLNESETMGSSQKSPFAILITLHITTESSSWPPLSVHTDGSSQS